MPWGYTGVFELENGGGLFSKDFQTRAAKVRIYLFRFDPYRSLSPLSSQAIWDFEGIYASSRHIPGVRFAGICHPVRISPSTVAAHFLTIQTSNRD